jgi:hypothetical protein
MKSLSILNMKKESNMKSFKDELYEQMQALIAYMIVSTVIFGGMYCIEMAPYWKAKFINKLKIRKSKKDGTYKPKSGDTMSVKEACEILGIKKKDLKNMSKEDIKKAYKRKCQEIHPDKGGDPDNFINLKNAYASL